MKMSYKQFLVMAFAVFMANASYGVVLSGSVPVNQTSDTAANAKINAMNIARRQILMNVLSKYATKDDLVNLIRNASSDELMNLIESVGVADEQISSNTYSATVKMNIDNEAVKKWLDAAEIQNWIPARDSDEKFTSFIVVQHGISDWAELNRIAREGGVVIETQSMTGNQIVVQMPLNYRTKFTDNNGVLQVWK